MVDQATLKQITPATNGDGERFSWNLARYLHKHPDAIRFFYERNDLLDSYRADVNCAHRLYVGFMDGGSLIGSRVSEILGVGRRAGRWAYPPKHFLFGLDDVSNVFLPRYMELGKCALDPEHCLYVSDARYEVKGDESMDGYRKCVWCGRIERLQRSERIVLEGAWEPVGA
jgi:hypothetical protein